MTEDSQEVLDRFSAELDLVEILAKQVGRSIDGVTLDELRSYGREGLLEAARRFDPSRGVSFRSFANYRVRGAMIDGMRSASALPRRVHARLRALEAGALTSEGALEDLQAAPTAPAGAEAALNAHLAAMATAMATGLVAPTAGGTAEEMVDWNQSDPEEAVGRSELLGLVHREISNLADDEAELVRRHYFEGERFDRVAADLGLSKSWASRLHTRALAKLTRRLRRQAE